MTTQKARTFKRGLGELKRKDYDAFRAEFMTLFSFDSRTSWSKHVNGLVAHTPADEMAIEQMFEKYSVDKSKIWDR